MNIEGHRSAMIKTVNKFLTMRNNWGAWMPACIGHVYNEFAGFNSNNFQVPQHSSYTPSKAIGAWYNNEKDEFNYRHID
jgi:hypothetical protein